MATSRQNAANRRNAQLSTGPRTEAGKAVSRMNALKTGIHAESLVIPGEDPAALDRLAAEYTAEFQPVTPRQRDLVDTLVYNEWKIRRLRRLEAEVWQERREFNAGIFSQPDRTSHAHFRKFPFATAYDDLEQRLDRLQRQLHAFERSSARAIKELHNAAAASAGQPIDESAASGPIGLPPAPPLQPRIPPPPAPIGFVPSGAVPPSPAPRRPTAGPPVLPLPCSVRH